MTRPAHFFPVVFLFSIPRDRITTSRVLYKNAPKYITKGIVLYILRVYIIYDLPCARFIPRLPHQLPPPCNNNNNNETQHLRGESILLYYYTNYFVFPVARVVYIYYIRVNIYDDDDDDIKSIPPIALPPQLSNTSTYFKNISVNCLYTHSHAQQ